MLRSTQSEPEFEPLSAVALKPQLFLLVDLLLQTRIPGMQRFAYNSRFHPATQPACSSRCPPTLSRLVPSLRGGCSLLRFHPTGLGSAAGVAITRHPLIPQPSRNCCPLRASNNNALIRLSYLSLPSQWKILRFPRQEMMQRPSALLTAKPKFKALLDRVGLVNFFASLWK